MRRQRQPADSVPFGGRGCADLCAPRALDSGYGPSVKTLVRWIWRFVTLVTTFLFGGTPKWLEDKIDEEDRHNRLI
jgi:hypothetical protein